MVIQEEERAEPARAFWAASGHDAWILGSTVAHVFRDEPTEALHGLGDTFRPRACAKNGSPVHDREKSGPRGLLLVPVYPRAVSGAADDNGERGNVKPDVRRGARQAYWVSGLFQWGLAFEHLIDRSRRPRARAAQPWAPADRPARRLRETGRTVAAMAEPGDYIVCLGAGSITQWAYALPAELAAVAN